MTENLYSLIYITIFPPPIYFWQPPFFRGTLFLYVICVEFLSWKDVEFYQKFSCIIWDDRVIFKKISHFVMWYIISQFWYIKPSLHLRDKLHLVMVHTGNIFEGILNITLSCRLLLAVDGEGNGNPLQSSCWEISMDRGAWWATVHGVAKSWAWLSDSTHLLLDFKLFMLPNAYNLEFERTH